MADRESLTAIRSYHAKCVAVRVHLRPGYARIDATTNLTTDEARMFAKRLVELADLEDAAQAKKDASEERRKRWREREIAAGRMIVMDPQEFFRRHSSD